MIHWAKVSHGSPVVEIKMPSLDLNPCKALLQVRLSVGLSAWVIWDPETENEWNPRRRDTVLTSIFHCTLEIRHLSIMDS